VESVHGEEHDNRGEDQEVGVEKEHDAGVVEAPAALQAAGGFSHAPGADEQSEKLPG